MSVVKLEKNKEINKKSGLLTENPVYKPFRYPWCYDAWLTQQRIHWLPEEVPLGDDVRDWQKNLSQPEKNLLTQKKILQKQLLCLVHLQKDCNYLQVLQSY